MIFAVDFLRADIVAKFNIGLGHFTFCLRFLAIPLWMQFILRPATTPKGLQEVRKNKLDFSRYFTNCPFLLRRMINVIRSRIQLCILLRFHSYPGNKSIVLPPVQAVAGWRWHIVPAAWNTSQPIPCTAPPTGSHRS